MAPRILNGSTELKAAIGEHLGYSDWMEITQERVNQFAEATGDHQWIHIDVERAKKESPFGGPIAHGYLTLSLAPVLLPQVVITTGFSMESETLAEAENGPTSKWLRAQAAKFDAVITGSVIIHAADGSHRNRRRRTDYRSSQRPGKGIVRRCAVDYARCVCGRDGGYSEDCRSCWARGVMMQKLPCLIWTGEF